MLFRNTTPIYPYVGNPEWNLTTAMADDAIQWMDQLNDIDPRCRSSCTMFPAERTRRTTQRRNGSRKTRDMHLFDNGWNALRDQIFANQKKLGVIPQDAKLTPWPDQLMKRGTR